MPRSLAYVLIEPNELLRDGIESALASELGPARAAVGSVSEAETSGALETAVLAVADIGTDPQETAASVRILRTRYPQMKILILAECYNPAHVVAAIEAGADGYQLKSVSRALIAVSVDHILLGGLIIPSPFRNYLSRSRSPEGFVERATPALQNLATDLSGQEMRILARLVQGCSNKAIAREFGLSDSTIKTHVKAVFRKLGVSNRTQAAIWARDHLPGGTQEELQAPGLESDASGRSTSPKHVAGHLNGKAVSHGM